MARIDATESARNAAADDNLHDLFVKDLLTTREFAGFALQGHVNFDVALQTDGETEAEKQQAAPVKSADGKGNYTSTESGAWQFTDRYGKVSTSHADFPDQQIRNVERQPDKSVKLTLASGVIIRELENGSRAHFPDEQAFQANHPSAIAGRATNIQWDGDKIKSYESVSKKTTFYQVADNSWSTDPNARTGWNGKLEFDGRAGLMKRTALEGADKGTVDNFHSNGINETFKPDGSMEVEIPLYDGSKMKFKFKEAFTDTKRTLKNPEEYRFIDKNGTETVWKRTGTNQYESNGGNKWKAEMEVTRDGAFTYKDLDTNDRVVRTLAGREERENVPNKTLFVKENGNLVKARIGDQELEIDYGPDKKAKEIRHVNENRKWVKADDGTWSDVALDGSKPYQKPGRFEREIMTNADLDAAQKFRMTENVRKFLAMKSFTDAQKDLTFKGTERLLTSRPDSVMTDKEKVNYADQLFWHVVNDKRNEQGFNNTCNVTVLRGVALKEKPWVVANLAADFADKGKFGTTDSSTIEPQLASVRVRPGSPEDTFPPKPGVRTALSKLWDVCAVNASLQRETKDPFGTDVPKGTLSYEEVAPTGRSDTGGRIVWRNKSDGRQWELSLNKNGAIEPWDSPRMYPARIADSWYQMTGEKLTDRFLLHTNRYTDDDALFLDLVGNRLGSEKEVEDILKKNPLVICQGNTGILKQKRDQQLAVDRGEDPSKVTRTAGGEHVWLVCAYDPQSRTVSIDNSWDPGFDMPNLAEARAQGRDPAKTITLSVAELFQCMEIKSPGSDGTMVWQPRK